MDCRFSMTTTEFTRLITTHIWPPTPYDGMAHGSSRVPTFLSPCALSDRDHVAMDDSGTDDPRAIATDELRELGLSAYAARTFVGSSASARAPYGT